MTWALAIAVKFAFLVILFGAARLIAMAIVHFLPDGKLKRILMYDDGTFP